MELLRAVTELMKGREKHSSAKGYIGTFFFSIDAFPAAVHVCESFKFSTLEYTQSSLLLVLALADLLGRLMLKAA